MSRILFRYIFWDLFRIFMMANGALAGIMSFAGLLKPLTHNGLDAGQVGKLLTWFTPAMCAYSFPVAALFAATVVYGRLSADNELTACRASGIPQYMVALPALVLGLVVAIISLLFLCFIVPASTLKVEKVIYSNLAAFMQSKIERNHQIRLGTATVFAQRAEIIPATPDKPYLQRLVLDGPTILTYEKRPGPDLKGYLIPDEFWMARKATLYIQTDAEGDNAELTAVLDGGMKFPRKNSSGWEAGVEVTQFGPLSVPSRVKENTKFMDIKQLKELEKDTRKSRRISALRLQFIAEEQESMLHSRINAGLTRENQYIFAAGRDVYSLSKNPDDSFAVKNDRLVITSKSGRSIRLTQDRNGVPTLNANAGEVRLRVRADVKAQTLNVALELANVVLHEPDGDIERGTITQGFTLAMPPDIAALSDLPVENYASPDADAISTRKALWRELLILKNDIAAELNSRGAFAVSCLFLVMAGCALGMMFKSGNFLSAFALSFIPAILCITLIIAGQRTCGNVPQDFWKLDGFRDPLKMGIVIIWSGNAAVAALAATLMWRLHRT